MTRRPASGGRRPAPPVLPYIVTGVLLAVLMFGVAGYLWFGTSNPAAIGGPFTLENGAGQMVTDKTFRGKYMLVYFGYTYCPDVCPTTLQSIGSALDAMGPEADRVVPVFVTVDPWRDTPAVVQRYAQAFSPRMVGLTGTPEQIARVEKEYHVYAAKHPTGKGQDYSMDHSSVIYLMGPDGQFIAPVREDDPKQMAADLKRLIA